MVRAWGWVVVASIASALVACSMLKKKAALDGGEDGAASADAESSVAPAPQAAQAANDAQITRYPDEKAFDHATLTTESPANVRTQAGSGGDLVVVLKRGTEVEKIAEHGGSYLVIAEDPKDPSRKLMGWVVEAAFGAEPVVRRHDHDGGASGPVEAGTAADAGKAPAPTPDAGAQPSAFVCVKQSPPGKCPAGYTVSQAVCRLACKAAADCKGPDPKCNAGLCYASNGCQ
jgi:hypothetical protein